MDILTELRAIYEDRPDALEQRAADEIERLRANLEALAQLKELHLKPGAMELKIQQDPALAQWVAQCFAALLLDAPNYIKMKFEVLSAGAGCKWITVLVQKHSGKTPHELREEAEAERDALRNVLQTAAKTFRAYEMIHAAKGDSMSRIKAKSNADMAQLCEDAAQGRELLKGK